MADVYRWLLIAALGIVFNLRRYDHLFTHRVEILGVPIFDYNDFHVVPFFFKLILMQRSGYLFADLLDYDFFTYSHLLCSI
jgi:hypothetical protein